MAWLMIGTIVGGTSSVVIMPSIGRCNVPSRVARMLEVESAATDGLSVVVVMVLIDLMLSGKTDLSRPFLTLGREVGIGFAAGIIAAMLLIPGIPGLRDKPHGYTVFLAAMLGLYGITTHFNGNGAMAVLTASLLVGNAAAVITYLIPGAQGEVFTASQTTHLLQDQFTFLIKSFFFFLIGLMFPTSLRLIALALVASVFLFASRIPATMLTTLGMRLNKKEFWFTTAAIPRGLAAGVLATLPYRHGIPYTEELAPAVFAVIVITAVAFAISFTLIGRMPDEKQAEPARAMEAKPAS
jgi:cell volume regulation protein A